MQASSRSLGLAQENQATTSGLVQTCWRTGWAKDIKRGHGHTEQGQLQKWSATTSLIHNCQSLLSHFLRSFSPGDHYRIVNSFHILCISQRPSLWDDLGGSRSRTFVFTVSIGSIIFSISVSTNRLVLLQLEQGEEPSSRQVATNTASRYTSSIFYSSVCLKSQRIDTIQHHLRQTLILA